MTSFSILKFVVQPGDGVRASFSCIGTGPPVDTGEPRSTHYSSSLVPGWGSTALDPGAAVGDGRNAAVEDGSTRWLPTDLPEAELRAMIERSKLR